MTDRRDDTRNKFRSTHPEFDVEGLLDLAEIDIAAALWDPLSSPRLDTYATYAGGDLNAHDDLSRKDTYRAVMHSAYNTWLKNSTSSQTIAPYDVYTPGMVNLRRINLDGVGSHEGTINSLKQSAMANAENWECVDTTAKLLEYVGEEEDKLAVLSIRHLPYPILQEDTQDSVRLVWPDSDEWTKPAAAEDVLARTQWQDAALHIINTIYNSTSPGIVLPHDPNLREDFDNYVVQHEWAALPYFDLFFRVLQKMEHPLWTALIGEIRNRGADWSQRLFWIWLNHQLIIDGNDSKSKRVVDHDFYGRECRPEGTDVQVCKMFEAAAVRKALEQAEREGRESLTSSETKRAEGEGRQKFEEERRRWHIPQPLQYNNDDLKLKYREPYYVTPVLTSYIHFLHLMWCAEDYAARQGKSMDEFDPSDPPSRELAYRRTRLELNDGVHGEKAAARAERAARKKEREKVETARRAEVVTRSASRLERKRENKRRHAMEHYGAKSVEYRKRAQELGYTEAEIKASIEDEAGRLEVARERLHTADADGGTVQTLSAEDLSQLTSGLLTVTADGGVLINGIDVTLLKETLEEEGARLTRRSRSVLNKLKYGAETAVKKLEDARTSEND